MEIIVHSIDELPEAARRLLAFAEGQKKFFFFGDLGAGKTSFIQAICAQLKTRDQVVSPTFALVNEYVYPDASGKEQKIHHLDLYRLESLEEAIAIGVEEYLYDDSYCLVEWPELIEPLASDEVIRIQIEAETDSTRKIVFLKD